MSGGGGGGGGGGGASRVSIPNSARKTIHHIKEIAGNHSDEEVYAMLRECNMDPNETTQKLLLQDTFHEVKRKRDRRKENANNNELADFNWRSGAQGRGGRGGKGSYSSRYLSHDTIGTKSSVSAKETSANQGPDKDAKTAVSQIAEDKALPLTSGSMSVTVNGPNEQAYVVSPPHGTSQMPVSSGIISREEKVMVETGEFEGIKSTEINNKSDARKLQMENPPVVDRGISAGTESSRSLSEKRTPEAIDSCTHGRLPSKSQGYEINHTLEEFQHRPTSSSTGTSGSRPPSNYSNRSQQLIGHHKVAVMEWKPKQTNTQVAQTSDATGFSSVAATVVEVKANNQASEKISTMLEKKLEDLQFSDDQHVIFPSHIQVPESERTMLSFGSFTASFRLSSTLVNGPDEEKRSTPHSDSTEEIEENVEESSSSVEKLSPVAHENDYSVQPHSPEDSPENQMHGESDVSNVSTAEEYPQSQQDASLAPEGPQPPVVETAPAYSTFGLIPQMVGSPFTGSDHSDSQAHDTSRVPGFVVPQPFDPSGSYCTQVYRPAADSDDRHSPFFVPGVATKYSPSLSHQNDSAQQESGNSLVHPTSGPATVTQVAGVMHNSIAVTHQPVPVFRHPGGVHIPHYPPNYIPYGPYLSPFYVPPSSLHPLMSNASFPQQHPPGSIYPPIPAAAPVKYPLSQFKTGTNNAISNHAGMAAVYGPYSSSQTGYSPSPSASTVNNSTSNDDLTGSQYKENSVYLAGQQSEGSTVWIPAPVRDVPNLQSNSFYGLTPNQHVAFTPTQPSHGAFAGIFHPTQLGSPPVHLLLQQSQSVTGAVEMVGPQGGVYPPPPQRAPINWANNF